MCEELTLDCVRTDLLIYFHQQFQGFRVHVSYIHTPFMMEEHVIAFTCGIDTHVKLILLGESHNSAMLPLSFLIFAQAMSRIVIH